MYDDIKLSIFVKIQRLEWAGHIARIDSPRPFSIKCQKVDRAYAGEIE
jgi:hypothetical protein